MNRHQRRAAGKTNAAGASPAATLQFGIANHHAGRLVQAENCYRQVLSHQPNNPDALHLLGCVYMQSDRTARGVDTIQRAIALHPRNAEFHANLAAGLSRIGRLEEAAEAYGRCVDLDATSAAVFNDYGKILEKLGKTAPALAAYAHGVMADAMFADNHVNLARMLHKLERYDDALVSFDAAIALQPDNADTLGHRSTLLFAMKRFDDALDSIERAVQIAPASAESHNIRGSTLYRMGLLEQALRSFERARQLDPQGAEIVLNRASALVDLHRFDEAAAAIDDALTLKPDYAEAHNNMGLLCLLRSRFARGWLETEWRWKCEGLKLKAPDFKQPIWLGAEAIAGKTVLLHSDQGLGDAVHFARYATLVAARGARVVLSVDAPLVEILTSIEGVAECVDKDHAPPKFDLHCPLSSLPLAFTTELETIPASVPYVTAHTSSKWRERLGDKRTPRIGLVWSGNPDHGNDHNRSLQFSQIVPLLDLPLEFYSLQKDVRLSDAVALAECDRLVSLGGDIENFADTTALLSELDLLITADTSIAHIAGAIAMPTWVLLPHTPDWRWLLGRDDSPWYPTTRLFRQSEMRQWETVIPTVADALREAFVKSEQEQRSTVLTGRRCNYSLSITL